MVILDETHRLTTLQTEWILKVNRSQLLINNIFQATVYVLLVFLESVISQLKTISQQFEEHQRMADDLLERVTPAAPKKRIQTAAYSMTNHDSMSREIDRGHSESCKIIRMTAV